MIFSIERRALQIAVFIGALVPISAGGFGALVGTSMLADNFALALDNHFRYLSGLLLAIGLSFWAFIPTIERRTVEVRLLTFIVVIGGLARGLGIVFAGERQVPGYLALGMELLVTPLLCVWQGRIAVRAKKEEA